MERSVLRGLAVFRWLAWTWMALVLLLARRALERPLAAVLLVGVAFAVTVWATRLLRRDPARLCSSHVVGVEVGTALALQVADGVVYRAPHVFTGEQPLGVAWPIAAVLSAGVAFGPGVGAATGVVLGAGRAVSSLAAAAPPPVEVVPSGLEPVWLLSLVTTTVLYALAGGVGGHAMRLIRAGERRITAAERELARAHAREHVARRLHDGVLQTLALVERRSDDPVLTAMAREQDRDLRRLLFGTPVDTPARELVEELRAAGARVEAAHGLRVQVLAPDDLPALTGPVRAALVGAVGEALTNAGRHAAASTVVVYLEPHDGRLFCSVRDDGAGFDPARVVPGVGWSRSITGRIEEVGGDVEVDSAPGRGTEVRLRVPA
ncbi:sensor histidine kinase [Egicoccus halophilus]|uniref:sensor histidine kinase n=1 Tax=Egicoccus halophilus TaxID=1670830 RepID=UPI0010311309|nr:ATP-binding protein [Egicoccus halophilus]